MKSIAGGQGRERGQTLVESALVLVLFLAVFIGLFDIGEILFMQQTIVNRVQAAARYGAVNAFDKTAVENMVLYGTPDADGRRAALFGLKRENVSAVRAGPGTAHDRVTVTVSGYGVNFISGALAGLASHRPGGSGPRGLTVQASLPYEYPN